MLVLYMSSDIALKVNYTLGVYKVYDSGIVPLSDYKTCDTVLECETNAINQVITSLEETCYVKA